MLQFPPRRILVAVEFSKESIFAWEAAKDLAARFDASLEAVYCTGQAAAPQVGLQNLSRWPDFRGAALKRLRARLGPGTRLHTVNADPVFAIIRLARDRACDLIVMGTRRRAGFERWVQGSTAEGVVHGAPCPVLVVPRAWRAPRWVLAPVHEAAYARRGLLAAATLARAYQGRLSMLEVVRDPARRSYAAKRLSVQAERLPPALVRGVRPELQVRAGNPISEILRASRGQDMIVLVARRKSLFGDMVLGTTVERVLRHSPLPVLAMTSP
ncbi:MAG: universal stress protein [Elusimicrobiota bacterium]